MGSNSSSSSSIVACAFVFGALSWEGEIGAARKVKSSNSSRSLDER
jgi:hypothetical protein